MRSSYILSVFFSGTIIAVIVTSLQTIVRAKSSTFFCGIHDNMPATIRHTPAYGIKVPIIVYLDENSSFPKQKCEEISQRLESIYSSGKLPYITPGLNEKGEKVICSALEYRGPCDQILFPLSPHNDPEDVMRKLTHSAALVSEDVIIYETDGRLYLNVDKWLKIKPIFNITDYLSL